jgi:ribosomal protein S18 acetylase RimI-like enzyme
MVRRVIPTRPRPEWRLRAAGTLDEPFIRELSVAVFSQFGDYGAFLPGYLRHPSVFTTISEDEAGAPTGFIMVALVLSEVELPEAALPPASDGQWLDAEILAIAVDPTHQTRGVGKRLMQHALDLARAWQQSSAVRSVQLNVADTNVSAIQFFQRSGFVVLNPEDGVYPMGQRSIRMVRYQTPCS